MRISVPLVVLWLLSLTPNAPLPRTLPHEESGNPAALYDSNPNDLWNRLFDVLFTREDPYGHKYGEDGLDPVLFGSTKHLLEGQSHREAIRILDEFLRSHGESRFGDPLKRAILQRDLWAVFDWSVAREPERATDASYEQEKRELQTRLAEAVRRLALSPEQIKALPDNYAQAVATRAFASAYDPEHRERDFLPPALFDRHGPWIEMMAWGEYDSPTGPAVQHTLAVSGRSNFRIFIRLPEGRKAAVDYFRQLWDFPEPWIVDPIAPRQTGTNPKLPSFPAGTEVALVRQMMLFDAEGKLVTTPIVESVQVRVYHSVSAEAQPQAFGFDEMAARCGQDFYEFRLSRPLLFAGQHGGLRPVARAEKDLLIFQAQAHDQFENPPFRVDLTRSPAILQECVMCHHEPGIASLNSRRNLLKPSYLQQDSHYDPPNRWWDNDGTIYFKKERYDWGLLNGYWNAR